MRVIVFATTAVLLATSLSGCAWFDDLVDAFNRPDIPVQRTALDEPNEFGYITDYRFQVIVAQEKAEDVTIKAVEDDGRALEPVVGRSDQNTPVVLTLQDGTWTVSYTVAGYKWETFKNVKVDGTPPSLAAVPRSGNAQNGQYTFVAELIPSDAVRLELRGPLGMVRATSLPYTATGLTSGLHPFRLTVWDAAGVSDVANIQVRAGDAKFLPAGEYTAGIVARYTNELRLWDLSDMTRYHTPSQAAAAVGGAYLGDGHGITPDDPVVQGVVDEALAGSETTTMQIAWSLYRWLFDNLEYDDARLESTTLMLPRDVIQDTEDPGDKDQDGDGIVDAGSGNGVKGGVCRSLAATYVSMLRAAGVPARLVSGYLAGNVNGFHAWVEFYGGQVGDNPGAWIPVDVSPIDGQWEDPVGSGLSRGVQVAMQSFGVRLPAYLALRSIPAGDELTGWSTAIASSYSYPQSSGPPQLDFAKSVEVVGSQEKGTLCFADDTLERRIESSNGSCGGMWVIDEFIRFTERLIDYGIDVQSASPSTTIDVSLSYPFEASVQPDSVEYLFYTAEGSSYRFSSPDWNAQHGKIELTIKA